MVNSNSEQIIIANNKNEEIEFISGSMGDITIKETICTILEGGEEAFKRRARKYGIKSEK